MAFIIPRIGDTLMSSAVPMHMFNLPFLRLERYSPSPDYLIVKRALESREMKVQHEQLKQELADSVDGRDKRLQDKINNMEG